jgi:hypothetical protein
MAGEIKYRILRPSDLVQYGDERWDFELGWVQVKDSHLERFSREYRRAGSQSWRFRRPLVGNSDLSPLKPLSNTKG